MLLQLYLTSISITPFLFSCTCRCRYLLHLQQPGRSVWKLWCLWKHICCLYTKVEALSIYLSLCSDSDITSVASHSLSSSLSLPSLFLFFLVFIPWWLCYSNARCGLLHCNGGTYQQIGGGGSTGTLTIGSSICRYVWVH